MSYTKLFSTIITSTVWGEDDRTRLVWITMLALADKNGEVKSTIPGLARIAAVPTEAAREAIQKFLSPDPDSRTKDDEGRRIEEIEGGWLLLNHRKYREMASREEAREAEAKRKAAYRARQARNGRSKNVPSESRNVPDKSPNVPETLHIAEAKAEADPSKKKKPPTPLRFPFDSPEFASAWNEWAQHRKEIRKPLTPTASRKQLAQLAAMGEADAITSINQSIAGGWQGLFKPRDAKPARARGYDPDRERAEQAAREYPEPTGGIPVTRIPIEPEPDPEADENLF